MKAGFLKPWPELDCPTGDGKNFVLRAPLYYAANDGSVLAIAPTGATDGPSIPQCLQGIIPATGGIWMPGVLHDGLWRCYALERRRDGTWQRIFRDFNQSTELFREAMENNGVAELEATIAYEAVLKFGQGSFSQDAAMPIPDLPDINAFPQPIERG